MSSNGDVHIAESIPLFFCDNTAKDKRDTKNRNEHHQQTFYLPCKIHFVAMQNFFSESRRMFLHYAF
jgi:hypothetical protein